MTSAVRTVPAPETEPRPERASLRTLLAPRSVAVVGAMQCRGNAGHETVRAIRDFGFTGRLYPINSSGRAVCGIPSCRTIADLPEAVDLLVIAVPADRLAHVVHEAGRRGIRSALVLSHGPGGTAPRAERHRRELVRAARAAGIHLAGPDSLGVLNTDPGVRLNASLSPARPRAGGLAMIAQSSAAGIAMLEHAERNGCGVAAFASLGDRLDVSSNDLLDHWHTEPRVRAVALYVESFGNPRAFARASRALARDKPVLAAGPGPVDAGRPGVLDELFAQAGVIRTAGLDELTDAARMLVDQPLPTGARLGVVGNAGGLTRLAVVSAEAAGLRLDGGGPIDTGAAATPSTIAAAVETVAAGGAADLLLVMIVGTRTNVPHAIMTAVGDVLDRHPRLAAACVLTGSADDIHHIGARRVPVYRQPDRAVGALAHAQRYATWRRECPGRPVTPEGIHPGRAAAVLERAGNTVHGWVPRQTTAEVLAAYGIVVQPLSYAYTGVAAVAAAEHLGYPVIARTAGSKRVRLGLTCATAVRDAFDDLTAPGDPVREVLLQRQVTAPAELSAAVVTEPPFGPVLQLGRRDERAVSLVPLTDADAGRMWRTLGCAPVLTGDRGTPAVDTTALERLLLRLGRLAADQPRIGRLELAPIYAGPGGVVVADARLRVTTEPAEGRR